MWRGETNQKWRHLAGLVRIFLAGMATEQCPGVEEDHVDGGDHNPHEDGREDQLPRQDDGHRDQELGLKAGLQLLQRVGCGVFGNAPMREQ